MEKLQKPIIGFFENFNIYLEDLKDITQVLEMAEVESIEIIVNDYRLENIEQLFDDKFSKIEMLEIKSTNPYVSINYNGYRISLYTNENNFKNSGIYNELKNIIIKTQNYKLLKLRKIFDKLLFLPFGMYLGLRLNNDKLKSFDIYMLIGFAITILYVLTPSRNKSRIFNYYSKNKTSFWLRNKDNILVSIISLLFGSFLTLIIQKILS